MNVDSSKTIKVWECKECNRLIKEDDSVAFHLIDGILYGWCRSCFERAQLKRAQRVTEQAA
jgi:hypothetical protein